MHHDGHKVLKIAANTHRVQPTCACAPSHRDAEVSATVIRKSAAGQQLCHPEGASGTIRQRGPLRGVTVKAPSEGIEASSNPRLNPAVSPERAVRGMECGTPSALSQQRAGSRDGAAAPGK